MATLVLSMIWLYFPPVEGYSVFPFSIQAFINKFNFLALQNWPIFCCKKYSCRRSSTVLNEINIFGNRRSVNSNFQQILLTIKRILIPSETLAACLLIELFWSCLLISHLTDYNKLLG